MLSCANDGAIHTLHILVGCRHPANVALHRNEAYGERRRGQVARRRGWQPPGHWAGPDFGRGFHPDLDRQPTCERLVIGCNVEPSAFIGPKALNFRHGTYIPIKRFVRWELNKLYYTIYAHISAIATTILAGIHRMLQTDTKDERGSPY
jgi:hypothetical protein